LKLLTSIYFIVNPISGTGKNKLVPEMVSSIFPSNEFKVEINKTLNPTHATELTNKHIANGADIIVACGGDGTINEIANCLVGSSVKLGIVPMGSGNGLASTLKIPKSITEALRTIKKLNSTKIDVGEINKHFFFSNTGIGFDASVINNYSKTKQRGLISYLRASFNTFLHNPTPLFLEIKTGSKILSLKPFIVFVSNTNEMGYNISLTPKASIQDGMLDAIVVEPLNKLEIIYFAFLLLIRKPQSFKKAHYFLAQNLEIKNLGVGGMLAQIDGESKEISSNPINITIRKSALSVIIP
tara:strand:- start:419 stop:1312 length:894 start_codon:yes stop_codon:yes gene_type:complete